MDQHDTPDAAGHAGITLRELQVLQALVAEGTASAAARRLGLSQPAVSRRLAQLETRLGQLLFDRRGGRLVPTVEAVSINEQLAPVFATLARIARRPAPPVQGHSGSLSVAAPPTIAHLFLAGQVAAFKARHPDLRITFEVLASDALVTGIAECRFDLGLTDTAVAHDGIRTQPLLQGRAICILPAGHPLAGSDTLGPADLDGVDVIALSRRHSCRTETDRIFDRAGVRPRIVIEAATNIAALEFVRAGLGIAVVNPFPLLGALGPGVATCGFAPALTHATSFLLPAAGTPSAAALDFVAAAGAGLDRGLYPAPD